MSTSNDQLSTTDLALGIDRQINLPYGRPVILRTGNKAVCQKTTQTESVLRIQNMSTTATLTVRVSPDPAGKGIYTIPPNTVEPVWVIHNWNGSRLTVSNMTAMAAPARLLLSGEQ